jgi:hypothetical protein
MLTRNHEQSCGRADWSDTPQQGGQEQVCGSGLFVFGAFNPAVLDATTDFTAAALVMAVAGLVLSVLLMNLLIAILSDSYERVQDQAISMYWHSLSQVIITTERAPV